MQLYEVWFQLHFENAVDVGRVLVCAADLQMAKEMVIGTLELPTASLTHCDAKRVKPNLFLLEREIVEKPKQIIPPKHDNEPDDHPTRKGLFAQANQLADRREYQRGMREFIAQQEWARDNSRALDPIEYECEVVATVIAMDDDAALRRLGSALLERSRGVCDESRHVKNVLVNLSPDPGRRVV
jgi:hypothetical protein